MKNYYIWFSFGLMILFLSCQGWGYDTCTDKNIEFCLEDGKPPVFDYAPPKKIPKIVKKKPPEEDNRVVLDTSTGFKKGEIAKEVETLGYGDSAIYEKLSKEGFNPEQDYFVEDKSGKEVLLLGGEKITVRRLSQPASGQTRLSPSGVVMKSTVVAPKSVTTAVSGVASGSPETVSEASTGLETKRVFMVDSKGTVVAKNIQIATNPVKSPIKFPVVSAAPVQKNLWRDFKSKYQSFKTSILMPRYEKAKAKIKNLLSRFLKRE